MKFEILKTLGKFFLALFGIVAVAFGVSILFAYPIKWLWNASMPEMFGLKEIGVWMAWKLAMLSGILVRGIQIPLK
jgi:hypothetical protein